MPLKIEKPTITREDGPMEGERHNHPAFAQIAAHRTTGMSYLYGSDFLHHSYIHIQINPSSMVRSLGHEWFFDKNIPYIDVALSEAQWATFVSSMDCGSGVSCTLQNRDGKSIPQLPPPEDRKAKHVGEIGEQYKLALSTLDALFVKISESGLSKKKIDELAGCVRSAHKAISDSAPYSIKAFDEHMENTVEKAKMEVNAYATQHLMSLGRAALENQPQILSLEDSK